jgi:hypothetical protein
MGTSNILSSLFRTVTSYVSNVVKGVISDSGQHDAESKGREAYANNMKIDVGEQCSDERQRLEPAYQTNSDDDDFYSFTSVVEEDPKKSGGAMFFNHEEEYIPTKQTKSSTNRKGKQYYVEETAWRHGGRSKRFHRNLRAQQQYYEKLKPLPPAPPINISTFPKNKRWSYDETTRVVHGNFTDTKTLDREDEIFLLQMMERDDITVITDGFAKRLDPNLWTLQILNDMVGQDVCHQFRAFKRRLVPASAAKKQGKTPIKNQHFYESFEEEGVCYRLQMQDYIRYIDQRKKQLHCLEQRRKDAGKSNLHPKDEALYRNAEEELFVYEQDGESKNFNCIDTVLYLIDYDIGKLLPPLFQNFMREFMAPDLLPGGKYCWMHEVGVSNVFIDVVIPAICVAFIHSLVSFVFHVSVAK